jgi:hypothetical protein
MKIVKTVKEDPIITTVQDIYYYTDSAFSIKESIKEVNGKKTKHIKVIHKNKNLYPRILEGFNENFLKTIYEDFWDLEKLKKDIPSVEDLQDSELEVYFLFADGHMLFDSNMKIVSIPSIFDYAGSLSERHQGDRVYRELINRLTIHPYVLKLEECNIPSYNSDFYNQRGIFRAKVLLPQEKYEEIYNYVKDRKFWSVAIQEYIRMSYCYTDINIYGDEITALLKKYWKKDE